MKVYDFSNCNFDNEILSAKDTTILLSRKFEYKGQQESRVIVSNLEEEKRLVVLINCQEVIEQTGYTDAEKISVINYLTEIKSELLESVE